MAWRLGLIILVIGLEVHGRRQRISAKRQPALVKINAGLIVGVVRVKMSNIVPLVGHIRLKVNCCLVV